MDEQIKANRRMRAATLRDRALYLTQHADAVVLGRDGANHDRRAALLNEANVALQLANELDPA